MITRDFFRKKPSPFRVHVDEKNASYDFVNHLLQFLPKETNRDIVLVCIGTDRSTGDALGPLIGTQLIQSKLTCFHVYGTLEEPVHAVNLEEKMIKINNQFDNPFIIGIDACLGRTTSVGIISINDGPVKPGAAVNKNLPLVGNIHITGIVNVGGFMEYMVLQNTRLHLVIKIAQTIAKGLLIADNRLNRERQRTLLQESQSHFFSGNV
ncbi:spore protease YyaC [Bacillaceae bacterium IKA-2]|nr:spore protease YyaC [Bacillaceae bacterium IKA-2]